jgi:hypothetical protein
MRLSHPVFYRDQRSSQHTDHDQSRTHRLLPPAPQRIGNDELL